MDETLKALAVLIAAFWWGGLVTLNLVITPARLSIDDFSRYDINRLGNHLARYFGRVQALLGVLLLAVLLIGRAEKVSLLFGGLLLFMVAISEGYLRSAMYFLDAAHSEDETVQKRHLNLLQAYMVLDFFKMLLGALLLAQLINA